MKAKWANWLVFTILSFVWGSSFILMKEGLKAYTPYQVASLRMLSAGFILLPFAFKTIVKIPAKKIGLVLFSGLLGNFIPAFLFCVAETQIDSSLAGILNSLTPMFTIVVGVLFFKVKTNYVKIFGLVIGFVGLIFLLAAGKDVSFHNLSFAALVLLATLLYGINVNIVGRYLQNLGALTIASTAFAFLMIPSGIVLYFTGFFLNNVTNALVTKSLLACCLLGIVGTSIATILFYYLVKKAGILFGSLVTYGIPVVAVAWGLLDGESLSLLQIAALLLILLGVYIVNKGNVNVIKFWKSKKIKPS